MRCGCLNTGSKEKRKKGCAVVNKVSNLPFLSRLTGTNEVKCPSVTDALLYLEKYTFFLQLLPYRSRVDLLLAHNVGSEMYIYVLGSY